MKRLFSFLILMWSCTICFAQYTMDDRIYDYIDKYKDLAMQEMEQYKIPASITLAQAIYASKAGTNKVAVQANNHFGITCHSTEWTGDSYYETDNHAEDYCFRKYATVEQSYRDHSLFISQRSRYVKLFYLPITDYKSWAKGLLDAGYSSNPHYADTLVAIIEKFYLMHYDRKTAAKMGDTSALKATPAPVTAPLAANATTTPKPSATTPTAATPVANSTAKTPATVAKPDTMEVNGIQVIVNKSDKVKPTRMDTTKKVSSTGATAPHIFTQDPYKVTYKKAAYAYTNRPVYENNKTRFIIARAGDTYKKLASSMMMTEANLRSYNDVLDNSEPVEDEVVYVEMKSTKSPVEYHVLEQGDSYRYIAQKYGVQLKIIIKRNSGSFNTYSVGDRICIGCK